MSATCGFASWRQSSYVYTVTRRPRARNSRSLDLPVGQACPSWGLSDHDWRPGPTERLSATSTDASSTTQTKVVAEVLVSAIPAPGAPAGPALKRCRSLQHIPADGTPPGDGDNCPSVSGVSRSLCADASRFLVAGLSAAPRHIWEYLGDIRRRSRPPAALCGSRPASPRLHQPFARLAGGWGLQDRSARAPGPP